MMDEEYASDGQGRASKSKCPFIFNINRKMHYQIKNSAEYVQESPKEHSPAPHALDEDLALL